jgi:hypothetical protein
MEFTFPNGSSVVANDERFTVELPRGEISKEGIREITFYVHETIHELRDDTTRRFSDVRILVGEVGNQWQTKRGNFTKRLSSAVYKKWKIKFPPEELSHVGNLARSFSESEAEWVIEFTRNLNLPASAFANDESCWWDGLFRSRCALKSWGGLAIRSYLTDCQYPNSPDGRAWIQPLNQHMFPTHDVMNAHAYVVYNGYEDLSGYTPARIIAQMTGKTYRKIDFFAENQYVNNNSGYLVSDEETCKTYFEISLSGGFHHQFDHDHPADQDDSTAIAA